MNQRKRKAKLMMETKGHCSQIDQNSFSVRSQTNLNNHYIVSKTGNGLKCQCKDHNCRKADCKHIKIVLEIIKKNKCYRNNTFRIMERSQLKLCKYCDSGRLRKDGFRKNKNGKVRIFECLDCKKKFSSNFGFEKMRYNPVLITRALQMYYSGMSVRDIADCFEQEEIDVSYRAVYDWVKKYSKMTHNYLKGIVPRVSETWRTDEIFMKISGVQKLQYSMLDHETRFMITQYVANTKGTEDVTPMFREAMMIADKIPTTLISDGAANFHKAWKENYKAKNFLWKDTEHIRHIHMKGDKNNNRMERLNGTIRDREVSYRGIKKMDSPLFEGFQTFYNFSKKHGGINGKTPAEMAKIQVDGKNKWKTIIQNASLYRENSI
ncbi:MAG: DDE-type integrase/transposase/recombinase [Nitrosopumilus sp.]|nr:DDE-type integrase/transposase/recombinase [Nitrosopumilus sp.]NRA05796.1 DDE-type integrase/transposase/recombinase [Nitrosopumilus sp.]